jgi:hypothetical protein
MSRRLPEYRLPMWIDPVFLMDDASIFLARGPRVRRREGGVYGIVGQAETEAVWSPLPIDGRYGEFASPNVWTFLNASTASLKRPSL